MISRPKKKIGVYSFACATLSAIFANHSVANANVVTNSNGTTTLENGKASFTLPSNRFKESDKTASELFKENAYTPDSTMSGFDDLSLSRAVDVKYILEDGTEIDDKMSTSVDETVRELYDITGASGKVYRGNDAIESALDLSLHKKDTIVKNGKTYAYVESRVASNGSLTSKNDTTFNDVTTKATVQGMHKVDGSIDYAKITGRVWLIEEKEDGSYGKFKLIENGTGLSDDKIAELSKEAAGTFSKAEVDKLGGIKDSDTVLVYETNTYAAVNRKVKDVNGGLFMRWGYSGSDYAHVDIDSMLQSGLFSELKKVGDKFFYKDKEFIPIRSSFSDNSKETLYTNAVELELIHDIFISGDKEKYKFITYFGATSDMLRDYFMMNIVRENENKLFAKISNGPVHLDGSVANGRPVSDDFDKEAVGLNIKTTPADIVKNMFNEAYSVELYNKAIYYFKNLGDLVKMKGYSALYPKYFSKLNELEGHPSEEN